MSESAKSAEMELCCLDRGGLPECRLLLLTREVDAKGWRVSDARTEAILLLFKDFVEPCTWKGDGERRVRSCVKKAIRKAASVSLAHSQGLAFRGRQRQKAQM